MQMLRTFRATEGVVVYNVVSSKLQTNYKLFQGVFQDAIYTMVSSAYRCIVSDIDTLFTYRLVLTLIHSGI